MSRIYKPSPTGETEDPELYHSYGEYGSGGLPVVHIGATFHNRYRIVHKIGFGGWSTAWLARDQHKETYVCVKFLEADDPAGPKELQIMRHLAKHSSDRVGSQFIGLLLDDFIVSGKAGDHICMVTRVGGRRLQRATLLQSTDAVVKFARQMFQGVGFLHSSGVCHGDFYSSNVLQKLQDFSQWTADEVYDCLGPIIKHPVQRVDDGPLEEGAPAYLVQPGNMANLEKRISIDQVLIIDFGSAFFLHENPTSVATPPPFKAPESLFGGKLTSALDTWSLGCSLFEMCSGYSLLKMMFEPKADVRKDMVSMLGKPPEAMWQAWSEREKYFEPDGTPKAPEDRQIAVKVYPLSDRVKDIEKLQQLGSIGFFAPENQNSTYPKFNLSDLEDLLVKMLTYGAENRLSINDALQHPFFKD